MLIDSLVSTFSVTGLTGGATYLFKVRAINIYDIGEFSTSLSVIAADVPGKPNIAAVTLDGTQVRITWLKPEDHYGEITAYQVLLRKADLTYVEYILRCDGSINPALSALTCTIPMLEIKPLTGITLNTLIQAIVRARNFKGWGDFSEPNVVGVTLKSLPNKMSVITINKQEVTNS